MNEKVKYIAVIIGVIVLCAVGWLLFRDIRSDSGTADGIGRELDSVAAEQSKAADSIERIDRGLDDSAGTVERIAESNGAASATAQRIADTDRELAGTIDSAKNRNGECETIIADSKQRIESSEQIIRDIRQGTKKRTE